jgi:hypothetical protein
MNTAWKLVSMSAAAAMVAACSHTTEREIVREQPVVQQAPATTVERVTVLQPPPAPQEVMPAPPAPSGYTWVPGHYAFRSGQWQWETGSWHAGAVPPMPAMIQESMPAAPYPGARWVPGYWSFSDNSWTWVKGHWQ